MKTNFFEKMKNFIIEEQKGDKHFIQYIRYYETMLQNEDVLKPILNDLQNWQLDIHFEDDETGGYTYGKYQLYLWDYDGEEPDDEDDWNYHYDQKYADYHYEIELTQDERYWGYCTCNPSMKDYNPKHDCCGNGCDWVAPSFTLKKIEGWHGRFNGVERDIWRLEEKWTEYLQSYDEKIKQEKLKRIEEKMEQLKKEKDSIENN